MWRAISGLLLALLLLAPHATGAQAQIGATVRVIYPDVEVRLKDTERWLPLPDEATMPLRAGDAVRTIRFGRALVAFADQVDVLLLPGSVYQIDSFTRGADTPSLRLSARLNGHLVQHLAPDAALARYRLTTDRLTITDPAEAMAVWSRDDQDDFITVARGTARGSSGGDSFAVTAGEGLRLGADGSRITAFDGPLNAPRLIGLQDGCPGIVQTLGDENLNIRIAPNEGDTLLGSIPSQTPVRLLGVTPFDDWYRIQVLSVFAWVRAPAVATDCTDLPVLPYTRIERNNSILEADPVEVELLRPFYGLPAADSLFYLVILD